MAAALAVGGEGVTGIALAGPACAAGSTLNRTSCIDDLLKDAIDEAASGIAVQCWRQAPSAYGV